MKGVTENYLKKQGIIGKQMKTLSIQSKGKEPATKLAIDTIKQHKQALIFCSSKRGAESQAEKIAKTINAPDTNQQRLDGLSTTILNALSQPTTQCKRLANCVKKGIAFHHAGLPQQQRQLLETAYREKTLYVICSTPTLAAGLDLPAFRTIIRDYKRFSGRGMTPIPVLEYLQMAGRAGRPGMESYGEAILLARTEEEKEQLEYQYVKGEPEDIYSKLGVEPVLRTHILSLIAIETITTTQELESFFAKTFYAHQYGNPRQLNRTLHRVITSLQEWDFVESNSTGEHENKQNNTSEFISASEIVKQETKNDQLQATRLGKRVSEIYIDPMTAHLLLEGLDNITKENKKEHSNKQQTLQIHHLISCSLEMRPLIRMRKGLEERLSATVETTEWLIEEDEFYMYSQDDFEETILTALFLNDWAEENNEQELLATYGIRPGEITIKLQKAEWLLYACEELSRVKGDKHLLALLRHVRMRTKNGVKSELIPLLRFKNIGRVRARKLYEKGIKSAKEIGTVDNTILAEIIGSKRAVQLKAEVGITIEPPQESKKLSSAIHNIKDNHNNKKQTNLTEF